MVFECIIHTASRQYLAAHKTPAVWGAKEAQLIDGQWVGVAPFEIVSTPDLDPEALPETVALQCSWGELVIDGDLLAGAE